MGGVRGAESAPCNLTRGPAAPVFPKPASKGLTRRDAMALMDELIAAFTMEEFQDKQAKLRQELCLPVQAPVLKKYGFEPTQLGVVSSVAAVRASALGEDDAEI